MKQINPMRVFLALMTLFSLSAVTLMAGNVHLKGGAKAKPTFTDNGLTLTARGGLVGLGNGDLLIELTATGDPTATCTNPSGRNQPPGQNPAEVVLTGTQSIPESEFKNGTVNFSLATDPPETPIEGAPDCPGTSWTENITDVAFTSATITVEQGGSEVLTVECTFDPPTRNGTVRNVTCSQF